MNKKANVIGFLKKTIPIKIFGVDKDVALYIIFILIGLIVVFFSARHMLLKDKWHTLNMKVTGYSIDYPALWSANATSSSHRRGRNGEYRSATIGNWGLNIDIHQTSMENPELTEAFEWWQETISDWKLTDISSPVETQIGYGNYPAMMQSYYDGSKFVHAYIIVSDNRTFLIEFERMNENYQPIVDQMLTSFRLHETSDN